MSTSRLKFGLPVRMEGMNQFDCRDVYTFWDDFLDSSMSASVEVSRWKSATTAGTVGTLLDGTDASQELAGGIVALAVEATASDISNMMVNGESFQIATGHELYFEARFMLTHVDVSCFVGLSNSDAAAIAGLSAGIGFLTVATVMATSVAKGTTANIDTVAGITVAANTWYTVSFHYDGDTAITFRLGIGDADMEEVNQLHLTTTADYIPDDIMLTPTLEAENQGGTSVGSLYVDYILCQQERQRVAD